MTSRTYFKVNRARFGQAEVTVVVNELVPIPPPGTRILISKRDEGSVDAEVISAKVEIMDNPSMYEQTIFCNGWS